MSLENWGDREAVDNVDSNKDNTPQTDNKEVIMDEKWDIPDLKTLSKEDLKDVKKLEFVVHPLYDFLFQSYRSKETEDIDGDFDQILLRYFNKLCEKDSNLNRKRIPGICFYLLAEMVEEIQDYMKPCPEGTIRVFLMPNISDLENNEVLIMNKFLHQYGGKNVYTLNSAAADNGYLIYEDRLFLGKNLPEAVNIELQGGYIEGCLDRAIESFNDINIIMNRGLNLNVDLVPSTGGVQESLQHERLPVSFKSVDDAITWLINSSSYKERGNTDYLKKVAEYYRKKLKIDCILDEIDDLNGDVKYGDTH